MEQPKFQWSRFNQKRTEQFVVRCDDFDDFIAAIQLVLEYLSQQQESEETEPEPEIPSDQCQLHNVAMKKRTSKNGGHWYDHRWQEGNVWNICNGKTVRVAP